VVHASARGGGVTFNGPPDARRRRILAIGGLGYIGSMPTGALLQRGDQVTVVDDLIVGGESLLADLPHPSFRLIKGDVSDRIQGRRMIQDPTGDRDRNAQFIVQ
jgi:nucleoside-diphosphate-sugar epimerase